MTGGGCDVTGVVFSDGPGGNQAKAHAWQCFFEGKTLDRR